MRIRHKKSWAVAAAVVGAAIWLNPNLIPDIAPFPPSSARPAAVDATGEVGTLLQQVSVVDRIPDVGGYDRGCRRGEGPLTELTAQFAQV